MKKLTSLLISRVSQKTVLALAGSIVLAAIPVRAGSPDDKLISPTQPQAQKSGLYIGLFGGANVEQTGTDKFTYDVPIGYSDTSHVAGSPSGANMVDDQRSSVGFVVGLKAGYEFQTPWLVKPVLELEGFYSNLHTFVDEYPSENKPLAELAKVGSLVGETTPGNLIPTTKTNAVIKDDMQAGVFMLNAIGKLDFGKIHPYFGAGIGLACVDHDSLIANFGSQYGLLQLPAKGTSTADLAHPPLAVANLNGGNSHGAFNKNGPSEVTLAYQGILGVDFDLTDRLVVFAEYKALFFYDGPYTNNMLNNIVIAGVKLGF